MTLSVALALRMLLDLSGTGLNFVMTVLVAFYSCSSDLHICSFSFVSLGFRASNVKFSSNFRAFLSLFRNSDSRSDRLNS